MATASILWRGADKFEIIARKSYDDYNQSNGLLATLVDSNASVGGNIPLEYVSGSISSMIMNTYSGMYTFKGRAGSWSFSAQFRGRATRAALPILKVFWRFGTEEDNKKIAEDSVVAWAEGGASAMNAFLESQGWSYVFERQLPLPLSTPTGLYADNITSDSATTHWTGDANASNYKVQYKAAGDTVWTETYTD